MKYKIVHHTSYVYDSPAVMCHNLVYQKPILMGYQSVSKFKYHIEPEPEYLSIRNDFFENEVIFFSVLRSHSRLDVEVKSHVEVTVPDYASLDFSQSLNWEAVVNWLHSNNAQLNIRQFFMESDYVKFIPGVREYAMLSFTPERPVLEAVKELTSRIFNDFSFTPGFTDVSTPLEEVFKERKGVCQDFAHFQLACLRSVGLAARYMSGYIETLPPPGKPKLVGADASHAWIAVFVPNIGWVEFDATNNLVVKDQHIRAAVGRDFTDIVPLKGVVYSGGTQQMQVSVDVRKEE
ncbi:transglutaminase family protein [Catalinimonas sp. 4WD22]|uniref:transglutaminase family protein n=1 Tax=Catalinimonas locisalis TaxID=3133978 RepID=UPI003100B430